MYIVICEDEPVFAGELQKELGAFFAEREMEYRLRYCAGGEELRAALSEETPDLLFMDIHLQDADGVELVREINQRNLQIPTVFLSSLEERIGDGYDVNAVHFLLKRNYKEKLLKVLTRFLSEIYQKRTLVLQHHDTAVVLGLSEIYYVEPDGRNTMIYTVGDCYLQQQSIQNFARNLPENQFIEVYHSLFINIDHIRKVNTDTVQLDNDKELPVSRRKRAVLMTAVMRRLRER